MVPVGAASDDSHIDFAAPLRQTLSANTSLAALVNQSGHKSEARRSRLSRSAVDQPNPSIQLHSDTHHSVVFATHNSAH